MLGKEFIDPDTERLIEETEVDTCGLCNAHTQADKAIWV